MSLRDHLQQRFVKIDNWEKPSLDLKPEVYQLTATDSRILYVPEGYANGIKANEPDSILLVYSNKILSVALMIVGGMIRTCGWIGMLKT